MRGRRIALVGNRKVLTEELDNSVARLSQDEAVGGSIILML